jgi:carbamate kinase
MLVVAALGGNALMRRGDSLDIEKMRANVRVAASALAPIAREHRLVVTHGNGPQVGLLAMQGEAFDGIPPYPLDVLGAETEGQIGYLLEQELGNELPGAEIATLLTQVVVSGDDPAFDNPTKFVGPVYDSREQIDEMRRERGWHVARDGAGWRRVVASPEPRQIVELPTIRRLVDFGTIVITAGGGGIPVVIDGTTRSGVQAVVDKDLTAALLATALEADALLLLTDVDAVYDRWGTPDARPIRCATVAELQTMELPAGSMRPKVDALCRYAQATSRIAAIGALADAPRLLMGQAGTSVHRS